MAEGKKIFVTGASGFIGKHLVEQAVKQGFEVYAMVRKSSDTSQLKHAHLVYGDVTSEESMRSIFSNFSSQNIKIDCVVHAAALTKSNSKQAFYNTNYEGTEKLLRVMQSENIKPERIIFLSSLAACGPAALGGMIQLSDSNPVTLYGKSKLQAEPLIKNSGIPYIIIRPTAVYGPGEKDLLTVFKFINKNINPLLGNRPQELTFIYVEDLVNLILKSITSAKVNETYFATDGKIYSRHDLTLAISKALNKKPFNLLVPLPIVKTVAFITQSLNTVFNTPGQLNLDKYNELVAESWNCDLACTIADLQFKSEHDLYTGAQKTVDWYKQNKWI